MIISILKKFGSILKNTNSKYKETAMYLWVIIRNDDDTFTITEIQNGTVELDETDDGLITGLKVSKWFDLEIENDDGSKRTRFNTREEVESALSDFNMKIEDFETISDFAIKCGYSITASAEDDITQWASGKQVWIHYYKSDFITDD
jgi:hypothetical protein